MGNGKCAVEHIIRQEKVCLLHGMECMPYFQPSRPIVSRRRFGSCAGRIADVEAPVIVGSKIIISRIWIIFPFWPQWCLVSSSENMQRTSFGAQWGWWRPCGCSNVITCRHLIWLLQQNAVGGKWQRFSRASLWQSGATYLRSTISTWIWTCHWASTGCSFFSGLMGWDVDEIQWKAYFHFQEKVPKSHWGTLPGGWSFEPPGPKPMVLIGNHWFFSPHLRNEVTRLWPFWPLPWCFGVQKRVSRFERIDHSPNGSARTEQWVDSHFCLFY